MVDCKFDRFFSCVLLDPDESIIIKINKISTIEINEANKLKWIIEWYLI